MLVGEHFNFGTRFKDKPLLYLILHKCLVFTVVLLCFHIVESVLKGILSVAVVCLVVLLPFFGFREIARVIGHRELRALMFARERTTRGLRGWGDRKALEELVPPR